MCEFELKNATKILPIGLGVLICRPTLAMAIVVVVLAQPCYSKLLKADSTPRPNVILIMTDDHH